jgi:hypothetical protein
LKRKYNQLIKWIFNVRCNSFVFAYLPKHFVIYYRNTCNVPYKLYHKRIEEFSWVRRAKQEMFITLFNNVLVLFHYCFSSGESDGSTCAPYAGFWIFRRYLPRRPHLLPDPPPTSCSTSCQSPSWMIADEKPPNDTYIVNVGGGPRANAGSRVTSWNVASESQSLGDPQDQGKSEAGLCLNRRKYSLPFLRITPL